MLIVAFVRLEKLPSRKEATGGHTAQSYYIKCPEETHLYTKRLVVPGDWRRGMINSCWWAESLFVCVNVTVKRSRQFVMVLSSVRILG